MTFPNLASSARNLRGIQRVLVVALLLLASVVFGWLSLHQLPGQGPVASWWPAAGINVVVALSVGRRFRIPVLVLVALLTIPVTLSGGRPLATAIITSVAIAAEAYIVTLFCVDRDDQPRLTTTRDVVRFFIGVLAGAVFMGAAAGATIALVSGGDFMTIAISVLASHGSAIIVIAPIALVNRLKQPLGKPHIRALHATLLAASVFAAFSPGVIAPLAFLPIPFLAWAAFSFSMSVALLEVIGASSLIVVLTAAGGGPFNEVVGTRLNTAGLIELYVITLSVTTMLIAAARNERQTLEERAGATARLLHEGFEQAQNGFVIVRDDQGTLTVMEANNASAILLPASLTRTKKGITVVTGSGLDLLLHSMVRESTEEVSVSGDDELPVQVTASLVSHSTFGQIVLVSIVDLRPIHAAEAAGKLQLEREQLVVEELRALNQQKDDFVSSVTHELRTPITTVIGFSEELESTELDPVQKNYIAIIQRNAERLLSVVEDVLTFSKRMPGVQVSHVDHGVDVTQAIVMVLDDLRHSIREKNIEVTTDFPDDALVVLAESNDMTRVLVNLITNSVKFTPAEGTLQIAASVVDMSVVITVADSGPGVAPGDLEKVFDRFYRSSRAAHDGVPGTGLGLSIVRELVESMKGTVALESDGSHGTTVRLILPLAVIKDEVLPGRNVPGATLESVE